MGDVDCSYDLDNLKPFYSKLNDEHDLVMGNSFAGGIHHSAMPYKIMISAIRY